MKLPEIKLTKKHYAVLGAVIILFLGWRIFSVLSDKPQEVNTVPVVRTMTVGETSTDATATYPGEVRGKYESQLAFQVPGKIIRRSANLGQQVEAGQVLMEIDPKDIDQQLLASQAAYSSAQANYNLARENYSRFQKLYEQNAVSAMVRDQYKTQFDAAASALNSAQAQLNASRNQMGYTRLVADHAGSIASVSGEVGQVVAAGTPVVTLVQDGQREIQIYVPENRLDQVSIGQKATVTFWALTGVKAEGTVTEIAPMADPVTRTYKVRIALAGMPKEAKLGMTAKVVLGTGKETALLLPQSAIYQTGEKPGVWVIRDKKATLVPVKVDGYEGNNVKISAGLKKGDVVVTGGINKLSEGQEVRLEGSEFK